MKKNLFSLGLMTAAVIALASCAKEASAPVAEEPVVKGFPFELVAGTGTKTTTADASTISWAENDALNVFHAATGTTTYGKNDKFTFESGEKFTGELKDGALTADAYDWYALYPYDSHIGTPAATTNGYTTIATNQNQAGINSLAHLAGAGVPLYGKALNVAKDTKPVVTMNQLCSVVKVTVTNKTAQAVHISSVAFTAPEEISGGFYVDFTGNTVAFAKSNNASKTATLAVSGEETLAANTGSASFYLVIKPFSATSGELRVVMNEECTKTIAISGTTTFVEGKIHAVSVDYTGPDVIAPETLPYENSLISGHEGFTIDNVSLGGLSAVWTDTQYGVKANGYNCTSNVEAYLVSPVFDLTEETTALLYFDHNIRYFASVDKAKEQATLEVKADEGDWTAVVIPDYSSNTKDTDYASTYVNLSDYCGHLLQLRFKYLAVSGANPGRWEIKNFNFTNEVVKSIEVTPTSLDWAADETDPKEITVTLNEGASGYTVTPTTDASAWNINKNGNKVTVSPKAANTSTESAKSITLTIAHADDNTLTKSVTCTQAKAEEAGVETLTMTISNYVTEHQCTVSSGSNVTLYTTLELSNIVTMSTSGEANCGSFWGTDTKDWRLYQNKSGDVTVSVTEDYQLVSVKLTYSNSNNGVLKDVTGANVSSGSAQSASGTSVTYTVGNTGDKTNGQVRITAIEVKYKPAA